MTSALHLVLLATAVAAEAPSWWQRGMQSMSKAAVVDTDRLKAQGLMKRRSLKDCEDAITLLEKCLHIGRPRVRRRCVQRSQTVALCSRADVLNQGVDLLDARAQGDFFGGEPWTLLRRRVRVMPTVLAAERRVLSIHQKRASFGR